MFCWLNHAVQRQELKDVSNLFPAVRFVTYRVKDHILSPPLLASALLHAANTVRFTRSSVTLSEWCNVQSGAVMFEGGQGPAQVSFDGRPRCRCGYT